MNALNVVRNIYLKRIANKMNIEIIGYKLKNKILEIGLYNQLNEPVSFFTMQIKPLANKLTNYLYINDNSFKACMACKSFFVNFDHEEYTIEEAIDFMNASGYVNFTGESVNE